MTYIKGWEPTPIVYGSKEDFNYVPIKVIPSNMCNRTMMLIPYELLSIKQRISHDAYRTKVAE